MRDSQYVFVALIEGEDEKTVIQEQVEEKTDNRGSIIGVAKILGKIDEKQYLNIYVKNNFGFQALKTMKKWCNKDVGEKLNNVITKKQHNVIFYSYNDVERPDLHWIKKYMKDQMKNTVNHRMIKTIQEPVAPTKADVQGTIEEKAVVCIYVRGECDSLREDRPGRYKVILTAKNKEKHLYGEAKHTTSNRMIITGLIQAIKCLNKPCLLHLYTHAPIGLKRAQKQNKGLNSDLLVELLNIVEEGNHYIEEHIGLERQEELKKIVK